MTRIIILLSILISINCYSQVNNESNVYGNIRVNARVYDAKTGEYLSFANIGIKKSSKGTISNEDGVFQLNIDGLNEQDSVIARYIGYKDTTICIADLIDKRLVPMHKDHINIEEFLVYSNEIDVQYIIGKVLENKSKNYENNTSESEMFIRTRNSTDIKELKIKQLKNSFELLSDKMASQMEEQIPKHHLSYTDFLGKVYLNKTNSSETEIDDRVKVKEEKIIKLKDDFEMAEIEDTLEHMINNTNENEYWKVASGIFSTKIETNDTVKEQDDVTKTDTSKKEVDYKNTTGSLLLRNQINRAAQYITMDSKYDWAFLYYPNQYNYKLKGSVKIDGENVYIISFTPKRRGDFEGNLYISSESYALIKAEYQYAENKNGADFSLLGISYTESVFRVSILFEKHNGKYQLKYIYKSEGDIIGIERKIELLKKRERFLLDKTIATYKVKLNYRAENLSSIELLVLSQNEITEDKFKSLKQEKRMKVEFVDKFDDAQWEGNSIIAPTQKMKEYQKH